MNSKEQEISHNNLKHKSQGKQETDEYKALQATLLQVVEQVSQDPEVLAETEEFRKKATSISPEKLLRPFDI